jgi:ribosomal protein L40E
VAESIDCPKCGAERTTNAEACIKCGLKTVRMETFAKVRDAKVSDAMKQAWQDAVAHWDDPKRHDAAFSLAAAQDALPWLGGRYRAEAKAGDEMAAKRIEKIIRATEATLLASASDRDPAAKKRVGYIALGIAFVILAIIGIVVYSQAKGKDAAPTPTPVQTR